MAYIYIEDNVVPLLITSAIEAYEITHPSSKKGSPDERLETFGLLWGYFTPETKNKRSKIIATTATIETSALRHTDWVAPDFESIRMKKEFIGQYWPNLELVGTFHSHPYDSLTDVNVNKGWRASTGRSSDETFWPHFHEEIAPEHEELAHLVIAITKLEKNGRANPTRLPNSESSKGYVMSAGYRKFWIRAYKSFRYQEEDNVVDDGIEGEDLVLDIPSLQGRME